MEQKFCTILFSKFSQRSTEIMGILDNAPFNFGAVTGLKPVCIDNDKIRKRISKSNTIKISMVPCILIARIDGSVEQYEGERAFEWVKSIIIEHSPPPPPPPVHQPVHIPEKTAPEPIAEDSDSDDSVEYIPAPRKKKNKKKKRTPVADILSDDSEDSDVESIPPKRPPVPIRSGAGGYDVSDDFGEPLEQNRNITRATNESGSQDANTKKSGDLMAQAMAMQKERESSGDNGSKSPFSSNS